MGTPEDKTASGPTWEVGSINVDSIKQILHTLANAFPFVDENSKNAMHNAIESVHKSGDPNAPEETASVDEVAALKARIAELEAAGGNQ